MEKARTHDGTPEIDGEAAVTFECELVRADDSTILVGVNATRLKLYGHSLVLRLCHELTEQNPM